MANNLSTASAPLWFEPVFGSWLERPRRRLTETTARPSPSVADGAFESAAAVVLAGGPRRGDRLTGVCRFADVISPVRLATLDVGVRTLPRPKTLLAFGVDEPLYSPSIRPRHDSRPQAAH